MPTVEERLSSLENYRASHDAAITAWWEQQWRENVSQLTINTDVEQRLRVLDAFKNKLLGSVLVVSFLGAGLGSAFFRYALP